MANPRDTNRPNEAGEAAVDVSQLKRALVAIKDLRGKLEASERTRFEPIAIVGIGCRFPGGVESPADFWRLLLEGRDAVGPVPASRWDVDKFYDADPDAPGKTSMHSGGFLTGAVDGFDAPFFNIAPREAIRMDPQQRLLLEVSWEALEHAGIPPASLNGSDAGVFFGLSTSDYKELQLRHDDITQIDPYLGTGGAACVAAGRVSYFLGLHGPAMAVDTACSSSLVAVDLAVQALRGGRCPLAIAGGVNLMLVPEAAIYLSKVRALSADGRCKAFDVAADGYGRGEGCGVVVLKRLSDAVAAGDRVIAVIRGSAVNHDGRSSGLTVPNGAAQRTVIEQALANARLEPSDVAYIEAHGTGTPLGDPIELRALGAVLGKNRPPDQKLLVGTAKTNLGHLEAAAGIAGLIKLALSLEHDFVPRNLHLNTPSPHIPWRELPIAVPVEGQPWPASAKRVGGVSSFGFSGTNAHVILEAAPADMSQSGSDAVERPMHSLPLSARSPEALQVLAERYASAIPDDAPAADVCSTAATGRSHFEERLVVSGPTTADLKAALRTFVDSGTGARRGRTPARPPRVAFLFTGQGCQYSGMGRSLYDTQPVFRAALDECQKLLQGVLPVPLLDVIHASGDEAAARLTQTQYTQPAIFAMEYALAQLWKSWGIEAAAVIGHSVGEYAAACVAGVLSLPDALRLVAARGRLMQSLVARGRMAAIFADEASVTAAMADRGSRVSIAAINGPEHFVVSGSAHDVERVVERMRARGVRAETLNVSHAFHSPLMDPILDAFEQVASTLSYSKPNVKFISNLTGTPASEEVTTARYWRDHLRAPVRFCDGVRAINSLGFDLLVEVGPHPVLCGLTAGCVPPAAITCLPSLRRGRDDWSQMLGTAAELYVRGASVDWRGLDNAQRRSPTDLPTYPFERQRFWIEPAAPKPEARRSSSTYLAGQRLRSPLSSDLVFQANVSAAEVPFLADHVIYGTVIFPAAGLIELALSAAASIRHGDVRVTQFAIQEPLVLNEGQSRTVQTILTAPKEGVSQFKIFSAATDDDSAGWRVHAAGELRSGAIVPAAHELPSLDSVRSRCQNSLSAEDFYSSLQAAGIEFGPSFRGLERLWKGPREAIARISPAPSAGTGGRFVIHPALLDTGFQILGAACAGPDSSQDADVYLPIGIERIDLLGSSPGTPFWACASIREQGNANAETITADLWWMDDAGNALLRIVGFTAKRASRSALARAGRRDLGRLLHEIDWQPAEAPAASADGLQKWLVLGEPTGAGRDLAIKLRSLGAETIIVIPGTDDLVGPLDEHTYAVQPTSRASLADMLRCLLPADGSRCGVIHMWRSAHRDDASVEPAGGSLMATAQALADVNAPGVRLWVVTTGAQPVEAAEAVDPSASACWGLARVIASEYPTLGSVRIDLDPFASGQVDLLAAELQASSGEDQVAFRGDRRFVARLVRHGQATGRSRLPIPASECWRLVIPQRGTIDNLQFESADRTAPGPGEIEVRVHSTGLNFRDVLNVLGMYPGDPGPLGSECSGVVTAVGDGVIAFVPGDEVMCMGGGSFRPYFTVSEGLVMRKPEGLSFDQAAGTPITFLTALYGLKHLAGMKAGDRVLIHAAAGGVGLAAVQLALRAGAEVFGTAGSAAKRRLLEDLGVHHVLNSRTLDFADEITSITGGRGVDIVLNSLAGEFITRSLSLLAPGGRFLEIGKADIWDAERVSQVNPHATYFAFDLGEVVLRDARLAAELYAELLDGLADGSLHPLPVRVFGIDEAPAAFRYMAQARHVGKIVVAQPEARIAGGDIFREDGAYLITGGLGALGLSVADWMASQGAGHLVLAGRSQPSTSVQEEIAAIESRGAQVTVVCADVSTEEGVHAMLAAARSGGRQLRGVIHAAGVLNDGVLADQHPDDFARVCAPKISGATLLDRLTRGCPLEHFVLFSSVASVMGSAGQGAYATANAFMDGLAHRRRALGLPAQSINWGPWADRGMAAALSRRDRDRMSATGFDMIATADALGSLERAIALNLAQVAVIPARWDVVCGRFAAGQLPPLLTVLSTSRGAQGAPGGSTKAVSDLRPQVAAVPDSEKLGVIVAFVRDQVAKALGLTASAALAIRTPFTDLGLDSLMAVELRNGLAASTGLELRPSLVYDHPCIEDVAAFISTAMLGGGTSGSEAAADDSQEPWQAMAQDLDGLSEQELAGLLSAGMASLKLEDR